MSPRNLFEKIWDAHVVEPETPDTPATLYVDLHLVHEVTSPQAFAELEARGLMVRRPDRTLATIDHSTPTLPFKAGSPPPYASDAAAAQVETLYANTGRHGIELNGWESEHRGVVHVIGPELGATQPGMTIVCGDSHTATHGAFGALAHGIGTSEVEHVLATQTLLLRQSKSMEVRVEGALSPGVTPKDLILHIIGVIGTAGGTGHVVEYRGKVFEKMSVEGRLTVCNMSIEGGARAGIIAPDETVFRYLKDRPYSPKGEDWDRAVEWWRSLATDEGAVFDKSVVIDAADIEPTVSWGTSPEDVVAIGDTVPSPDSFADPSKQDAARKSLDYMGLEPGTPLEDVAIENVFIGSCTNSRIEDLRAAAAVLKGRTKAANVRWAIAVPGSGLVKQQAEDEGLDRIFTDAGFEWREPGCSACLAMNPDKVPPGERCASTSNRNFVGRQGPGARTHLMSPAMAAAAAVAGHLVDVRKLSGG